MADEERKAEGQEPEKALDEAEARVAAAMEQEKETAAARRRATLLEEYSSASSMIKNLQVKADTLKKEIFAEMDALERNGFEAGDYAAARTQKSRSGLDNELLSQKVAKEVLDACRRSTTYWELKCVPLK